MVICSPAFWPPYIACAHHQFPHEDVSIKNLRKSGSIGLSKHVPIRPKAGQIPPPRPEITLNSRAGCPDLGTAYSKGFIGALNGGNMLENAFHLGNVG